MSKLKGTLEIRDYLNCSESTLMQRITNEGLPVKKVDAEYVADTKDIDKWLGVRDHVEADPAEAEKPKPQIEPETKPKAGKRTKK